MKTWCVSLVVLLTGLGASRPAWAQRPLVQEFAGSTVLLASGDTLRGPLTLYSDRDLLLLKMPDQTVRTVAALAVAAFAVRGELHHPNDYLDQYSDFPEVRRGYYYGGAATALPASAPRWQAMDTLRVRIFRTFRWNHGDSYADYRSPAFFEQLSRGPVLLLRRESLIERSVAATDPLLRPSYASYAVGALPRGPVGFYVSVREQFYLGTPTGEVITLRNPRRDLLTYFQAEATQLERYAKEYHLDFHAARDLVLLVNRANALRGESQQE